jgi:diacylglycerol kinase family enzyme
VFRLGMHAVVGDWRDDPAVTDTPCKRAKVWASHSIPALLDGESVRLKSSAEVIWRPNVVKVLSIPDEAL